MFTRSTLQSVVPQVLHRLRAITALPNHGTVAGQAVASLFFEELGLDIRGPVNDVDVFVSVTGNSVVSGALATFSSEEDTYRHIKFISSNKNLTIVSTSSEGLLNTTTITHPGAHDAQNHPHSVSQLLVEGFDLNAVAVGINLHTHQVVCSAEFLRFLEHKQIKVVSWLTPAHTLVRLARKMYSGQLRNITCNYAQQREQLEQVLFLMNHSSFSKLNCVTCFGERYQTQVKQFQEYLPSVAPVFARNDLVTFDVAPTPQREQVLNALTVLVEKLGSGGAAFLFHYNFDRLFETIVVNEPHKVSVAQLLEKAASNTISDGAILSLANQMIGGQPLVYPMGMDDNDCAVAFLQYDHREDPDQVQHIVSTYTQLSQFEKDIFAVECTFNDLLDFATHPLDFAYRQVEHNGGIAFAPWARSLHSARDADLFVQLMQRVGRNEELRLQLMVDFLEPDVQRFTFNVFEHLSLEDQQRAFNSVVEHIYLGVDTLFTLSDAEQNLLTDWMHHNSASLETVLPRMSSEYAVSFLMSGGHPTQPTLQQLNNVAAALKLVSDDALMENNGHVLHCLLRADFLPLLQERVNHMSSDLWNTKWIEQFTSHWNNTIVGQADKHSLFENVMLFREVGHTSSTNARRKM